MILICRTVMRTFLLEPRLQGPLGRTKARCSGVPSQATVIRRSESFEERARRDPPSADPRRVRAQPAEELQPLISGLGDQRDRYRRAVVHRAKAAES